MPTNGDLIQVQVHQSAFISEKDKHLYGLNGLCKPSEQSSEEEIISEGLNLPMMGLDLEEGLSKQFNSP